MPLTLDELEDIRSEHFADDLPIDLARMSLWSAADASVIVLAGGGTAVRGFGRRIRREFSGPGTGFRPTDVFPADNEARRDLVWRGAAQLARGLVYPAWHVPPGWSDNAQRTSLDALLAAKRRSSGN